MTDYPVLRLVVRYGAAGSIAASLLLLVLLILIGYPLVGWPSVPLALLLSLLLLVLGRSFTELVKLITEMLVPR